ncbi:MAG: potassium channel protein [Myxococcales bacterium]|nr:potassium channel protein [Myxococcales bacterium]
MSSSIWNRLLAGFVAMIIVVLGGATGYWWIGNHQWPWIDCLYMTIITVTTVGYGETLPGMDQAPYARGFTMLLLVFGTGVLVYFASMITAFVVEGDLRNVLSAQRMRKRTRAMKDHFVVCGAGSTGGHIITELLITGHRVVAIDTNEVELRELAAAPPKADFSYVVGDATDDEILGQVNLAQAKGLGAALSSDKDNLYLVVATRQITPNARIIARCSELTHVDKLKRAGADAVVSPNFIGGMRMVSEMVRPSVVKFLDEMLRDKNAIMRIEEVVIIAGADLAGTTLRDADIRGKHGLNVLAVRPDPGAGWEYNPAPERVLVAGTTVVVMGSAGQVKALRSRAEV